MIYNGFDGNKVNVQRTDHTPTPSAPLRPLQTIPAPQPRQQQQQSVPTPETHPSEKERQNHVIQKWQAQHEALTSKAKSTSKTPKLSKITHTPQPKQPPFRPKPDQPPATPPPKKKPPPPPLTPLSRLRAKKLQKAEPMNKSLEVGCLDYKRAMKDSTSWNKRILKMRRSRMPYFDVHTGTAHNNSNLYRTRQMRLPRSEEAKTGTSRDYLLKYEGRRWRSSKVGFDFYPSLPANWLRFPVDTSKNKQAVSASSAHFAHRDSSNDGFPSLSALSSNGGTGKMNSALVRGLETMGIDA